MNRAPDTRKYGLELILSLYRVARSGAYHSRDNAAFQATAAHLVDAVAQLRATDPNGARLLFLERSILVGTQYLKAPRAVYDSAMEVKGLIAALGGNEISFNAGISIGDVIQLVVALEAGDRNRALPDSISVRSVDLSAFDSTLSDLSEDELAVRQFASAIVVLRHLLENLKDGEYVLLQQLKRVSQSVLSLAQTTTIQKLGIRSCRNLSYDDAGRAVSRAIVTVSVMRQLSTDRDILSLAAMSALLMDVGRPRVAGMVSQNPNTVVRAVPLLSDDQKERLPASSVVVLIALGRLHDKSLQRLVIAYEAQKAQLADNPSMVHEDGRNTSTVAIIINQVGAFIDLLRFDVRSQSQRTPEEALAVLRAKAGSRIERAVVDLIAGVLRIFPMGTAVELATGWQGVVLGPTDHIDRLAPRVRIVCDPTGSQIEAFDVDLGGEDGESYGWIHRAIRPEDDDPLKVARRQVVRESAEFAAVRGDSMEAKAVPASPEPQGGASSVSGLPGDNKSAQEAELEAFVLDLLNDLEHDPTVTMAQPTVDAVLERFIREGGDAPTAEVGRTRVQDLLDDYLERERDPQQSVDSEPVPAAPTQQEGSVRPPRPSNDAPGAPSTSENEPFGDDDDVATDLLSQHRVDELVGGYIPDDTAEG